MSEWCVEHKRAKPCKVCEIANRGMRELVKRPELLRDGLDPDGVDETEGSRAMNVKQVEARLRTEQRTIVGRALFVAVVLVAFVVVLLKILG